MTNSVFKSNITNNRVHNLHHNKEYNTQILYSVQNFLLNIPNFAEKRHPQTSDLTPEK